MFDPTAMGAMGKYHLPAEVRIIDRAALRIHTWGWARGHYRLFDENGEGRGVCADGALWGNNPEHVDVTAIARSEMQAIFRVERVLAQLACERSWLTRKLYGDDLLTGRQIAYREALTFYNDSRIWKGRQKILQLLADAREMLMAEFNAVGHGLQYGDTVPLSRLGAL